MFRFLVIVASIVAAAQGFGTGAPPSADVCSNLTPKHGVDPQTEASPFSISINKEAIHAGDKVKVTLAGLNGEKFKGFLVQARIGDKIVGSFDVTSANGQAQGIDCPGGEKNAVTHVNPDKKSGVSIDWIAPADLKGIVIFKATFVKEGDVFWVGQTSSKLTVGH